MILMKQIITKSVVGVDQKILKKPEVKGLPILFPLFTFISITSDREVRHQMFIWKVEFLTLNLSLHSRLYNFCSRLNYCRDYGAIFYFGGTNYQKAVIERTLTIFFPEYQ